MNQFLIGKDICLILLSRILEFRFVATSYNTIAYVGAKASMGSQRLVIFEEERILVDLFAKKLRGSSSRKRFVTMGEADCG